MTGFVIGVLIVVALQGAIAAWEGCASPRRS